MLKQYKLKNYRFILVMLVMTLSTGGVLLVGSASPGDQKKQLFGMVSGLVIMLIVSLIDYSFILKFSLLIYLFSTALLGLVLVAGKDSKGAQRWFEIGGFRFQPSELVKILMILFFAWYFMKFEEKINTLKVMVPAILLIGVQLVLIILQPNLSTTIILAIVFAAIVYVAGINHKLVIGVLITGIPGCLILITLIMQDMNSYKRP